AVAARPRRAGQAGPPRPGRDRGRARPRAVVLRVAGGLDPGDQRRRPGPARRRPAHAAGRDDPGAARGELRDRAARGHARERRDAGGGRHARARGARRAQGDRDRLRDLVSPAADHPHRGHGPRLHAARLAPRTERGTLSVAGAGTGAMLFLGFVGAGLFSMVPYALGGARRDADVQGKDAHFVGGGADFLLHWFMWLISPLVRVSLRLGLTPDFYNYAGLALGAASGA